MGLLLVIYGAISLWLGQTNAASATRRSFCELMLCSQPNTDSPTAIAVTPNKTLAQARADLLSDPASAYRWADLADSEIDANNVNGARFSVRQALSSAPGNPAILFRAAHFYVRVEDYPEALQNLVAVLRNPELAAYYDRAFEMYSAMDLPLADLLNHGLPRTPQAANAFLRYWVKQNRLEEAEATWTWINQNSLISLQSAGSYVAMLAKNSRWDEAMQSWSEYTSRLDPNYNRTNWVYNGSFEMTPVDCPFDWHLLSSDAVEVTRDTEQMYKGSASLRLKYSQTPKESVAPASQIVLLKPGKWTLNAAMKTQGVMGVQGVVIRVTDAENPARLDVETDTFQRTQEWTGIGKVFEVGPNTRIVRLEITRPTAQDLNTHMAGSVWIDAITLAPVL